jgi:hypothetical protein
VSSSLTGKGMKLLKEMKQNSTVKALGDLKKVNAFTALYLRQYLTHGFDISVNAPSNIIYKQTVEASQAIRKGLNNTSVL